MATRASKKTKKKATKKTAKKTKTVAKKKVAKKTTTKTKTTTKPKAQTLGNSNKIELLLTENNSLLRGVINAIANLNGGVTQNENVTQTVTQNDPLNLVNAPATPATPATPTISKDQITEALQKVAATIGLDGVGELLKKFNAARVSDIQEKDYPAFVKACNDSTAQQGATANPQNPVMDMGAGAAPASANFL